LRRLSFFIFIFILLCYGGLLCTVGNGSMMVTSSGDAILLPRSLFTAQGSTSVLQYSPKSELDFGVVACWASNPVGNQREPCLFHVVPAGK
jgi:hypothetical protein